MLNERQNPDENFIASLMLDFSSLDQVCL